MSVEMIHRFIVCKNPVAPVPESVVEAVTHAGHCVELVDVRHSLLTALAFEIMIGNRPSRVYVDVSENFAQGFDLSTSDWEVVEEIIDPQEAQNIRRLIHVRAWEHVDAAALACLVEYLCLVAEGRLPERQPW